MNRMRSAAVPILVAVCLLLTPVPGLAPSSAAPAEPPTIEEPSPKVMIALPWDDPSIRIAPAKPRSPSDAATAAFSVNYLNPGTSDGSGNACSAWNTSAQTAFSFAASVWASTVSSPVPIRINACWSNLSVPAILGSSSSSMARDFANAPHSGTWYKYALADAIAGYDLDPTKPDMTITYNSAATWYFGIDGATPSGKYDFASVVMHEMAHGLNFGGGMAYGQARCEGANWGCWSSAFPNIYDRFVINGAGQALLDESLFPDPSAALGAQLTGDNLYFEGSNAAAANGGTPVKIYAPSTWSQGSSYSHLDYETYGNTSQRLMVYAIPAASSIHDPGPVTLGVLRDLGWHNAGDNPLPAIARLDPSSAMAGGSPFTLTVNGTYFVHGSTVRWKGANRATTYVSPSELRAAIAAEDLAAPGPASVTVLNPQPGGGASPAATFLVAAQRVNLPAAFQNYPAVWTTIASADFEGEFPGAWELWDDYSSDGVQVWGKRTCRAYAGSYGGWAAGGGAQGSPLPCGSNYRDNANSWLSYGPFSLGDARAAELAFKVWLKTVDTGDFVCPMASTDGHHFSGPCYYGDSSGWTDMRLDLAHVEGLNSLIGQPQVYVAILFESNGTGNGPEGAYVDNLVLRKCPAATCVSGRAGQAPTGLHVVSRQAIRP